MVFVCVNYIDLSRFIYWLVILNFGFHAITEFVKMNSMDEHNRMMHPTSAMLPQPYGMSSVDPNHGAPTPPDQDTRKQDIGEILQQIMNITDQSLDEAQAR